MIPGKLDLPIIWRGCTYDTVTLTWKDADGNPFDLTGWTPVASTKGFDLNAQVTDPVNGTTTISLTKDQTGTLRLGKNQWDWIWSFNGTVSPPALAGEVEVKEPTSKPSGMPPV